MDDKQKQIEEMAYSICTTNRKLVKSCRECPIFRRERPIFQGYKYPCMKKKFAEKFYNAGYRMQSDTAREILKQLKELLHKHEYRSQTDGVSFYQMNAESFCDEINELAAEYGVEVEE